MRLILTFLLIPSALLAQRPKLGPQARPYVSVDTPVVALTHVRVIDGTGAPAKEDQTVVIEEGRIKTVGPAGSAKVPSGARVIDLTGRTVVPGLFGLHDHSYYTTSGRAVQSSYTAPMLYLAGGVTTIRTTGANNPYAELNLKKAVDRGDLPGPHLFITGPYITGPGAGVGGSMMQVTTEEEARRVVAYWAEEGVHWIKFYTGVSRAAMKAAIDEGHKRGLKFTGHLCSVSFREAVELGIDALEHGFLTNSDYDSTRTPDQCSANMSKSLMAVDLSSDAVKSTFRDMTKHNVAMTSTLVVYELFVANRPPLDQRALDAMSPEARTEYLTSRARIAESNGGIPPDLFKKAQRYEYEFVKAGGLLASGVDPTGNGGALFGFGDQRNVELLVEAGFTPVQAIQIASANGAKALGVYDKTGSVEPGKAADLVVVTGNPGEKIADIRNVETVFKDGVGFDSAKMIAAVRGLVGVR